MALVHSIARLVTNFRRYEIGASYTLAVRTLYKERRGLSTAKQSEKPRKCIFAVKFCKNKRRREKIFCGDCRILPKRFNR